MYHIKIMNAHRLVSYSNLIFYNNSRSRGSFKGRASMLWRRPKTASIMVVGKAANIAIQVIADESHSQSRLVLRGKTK